jgi:hypothetical protein
MTEARMSQKHSRYVSEKISTFFSFSSEGENLFFSFLIFLFFQLLFIFMLSFSPFLLLMRNEWEKKRKINFCSAAAFVSFLSFLHTRVDDEISMLVLEKKIM